MPEDSALVQHPVAVPPTGQDALAPAHPEEMKAGVHARFGDRIEFRAQARATPAGLAATGLAVTGMLLGLAFVIRAARSRVRG